MPGLNLVILFDDKERFRGALTLALANVAMGKLSSIFIQLDATSVLSAPISAPRDAAHASHGLPTLAELVCEALDAGVRIIVCQSGLTLAGLEADALDPRIEAGGPLSFLQSLPPEDRLVIV